MKEIHRSLYFHLSFGGYFYNIKYFMYGGTLSGIFLDTNVLIGKFHRCGIIILKLRRSIVIPIGHSQYDTIFCYTLPNIMEK